VVSLRSACYRADSFGEWKNWYSKAADDVRELASRIQCESGRLADILALTSPRQHLSRNIRVALFYIERGQWMSGTMKSIRRSVGHYEKSGQIRGPKVFEFARGLRGDTSAIVLDVWTLRALGLPDKPTRVEWKKGLEIVRRASRKLGWANVETQASLWCWGLDWFNRTIQYYPLLEVFETFQGYRDKEVAVASLGKRSLIWGDGSTGIGNPAWKVVTQVAAC